MNYRVAFTTNKKIKRLKKLHSNKSRSDIKEMKINLVKYIFVSNLIVQPINIHFISCQKSPKEQKFVSFNIIELELFPRTILKWRREGKGKVKKLHGLMEGRNTTNL